MSQDVDFQPADFLISQEEFQRAGLLPEGMYLWRWVSAKPQKRDSKDGGTYTVFSVRLQAVKRAHYSPDGDLLDIEEIDPPRNEFQDFGVSGNSVAKLKSFYKAVTGRMPQGRLDPVSGQPVLDLQQMVDELADLEAWNSFYHSNPEDSKDGISIYGKMGFNFSKEPKLVKSAIVKETAA